MRIVDRARVIDVRRAPAPRSYAATFASAKASTSGLGVLPSEEAVRVGLVPVERSASICEQPGAEMPPAWLLGVHLGWTPGGVRAREPALVHAEVLRRAGDEHGAKAAVEEAAGLYERKGNLAALALISG